MAGCLPAEESTMLAGGSDLEQEPVLATTTGGKGRRATAFLGVVVASVAVLALGWGGRSATFNAQGVIGLQSVVEKKLFLARVAKNAERPEDMVDYLEEVLTVKGCEVDPDERDLLSDAFKNQLSGKINALHTISAIEQNPKYSKFKADLLAYRGKIDEELRHDCQKVIDIINVRALSTDCSNENKVFFLTMVGDHYRKIAENSEAGGELNRDVKNKATDAYERANEADLPACNPIKLDLGLKFAVFNYRVLEDHAKACALADTALQSAELELGKIDDAELDEADTRKAKRVIEELKNKLTLWKKEEDEVDDL